VFAAMRGIGLAREASGAAQESLIMGVPGPLRSAPSAAGMAWVAAEDSSRFGWRYRPEPDSRMAGVMSVAWYGLSAQMADCVAGVACRWLSRVRCQHGRVVF
jgi:hypothetical protein